MSTQRISFAGLASGLDSSAIIKSLVALERRPIGLLQQKKTRFDQQAKLFGTLRTKLDKLQELTKDLKLQSKVLDYTATADTENVVQLTAGDSAVPGVYSFKIIELAQAQTRASTAQASNSTVYTGGSLKFEFAGSGIDDVQFDIAQDPPLTGPPLTLDEIAAQVNTKSDGKIKADVVFEGGSGGYRLTFTSGIEGKDGEFAVTDTTGFGTLKDMIDEMNRPGQADNSGAIVNGRNAELVINGLPVERTSNSITDLIPGVTVQLTGKTEGGKEVKITVGADIENSAKKMQEWVDSYNDVVDWITEQSKVTVTQGDTGKETTVKANALAGDSTLRSVRSRIRSFLSSSVETGNEKVTMLSQIGIDSDRDGRLKFDKGRFEDAVGEDSVAVTKIFSMPTTGMATKLMDTLETFTDSVDGLIKARTDGIGRVNRDIDKQISRLESRMGSFEANLTRRYANLEQLIGAMESQRGALGALVNLQ